MTTDMTARSANSHMYFDVVKSRGGTAIYGLHGYVPL